MTTNVAAAAATVHLLQCSSDWLYLKCQVFRILYFSHRNIITIITTVKCSKTSV